MSSLTILNPATGQEVACVPAFAAADVPAAVVRARTAQKAWASLGFRSRAARLRSFARRLIDDPDLPRILMQETGKTRYDSQGWEVTYVAEVVRFYTGGKARRAIADDVRHPFFFANKRARVVYHPRGVVGVIGPWNFPIMCNFGDAIAPLMAGNAVILKPSPNTPLSSLHIQELWQEEGLPADLFQVLPGGADVGQALVDAVDMIFFTGSQKAGRAVAARAGERLIPVVLELGGKSPFIILKDADPIFAAERAVWSAFANAGQVCVRGEIYLVEQPLLQAFTDAVVAKTNSLRVGHDTAYDRPTADQDVGAIIFPPQIERLERQVADAVAKGAQVACGGNLRPGPGRFFEPTVLAGVTPEMEVVREETFGPLLPIMAVRDAEEALAVANQCGRGLGGAVFSADTEKAHAIARRMETGNVCINEALMHYFCTEAPLAGWQGTGLGHRHGAEALRQFCQTQTIVDNHPVLGFLSPWIDRNVIGFPSQGWILRVLKRVSRLLVR